MNTKQRSNAEGARKPAGGFCLIRGTALLRAWAAYRGGEIDLMYLRVWFACWEALARRCGLPKGRVPRYRIEELQSLVGGTARRVGQAVRVLDRVGLVSWSPSSIVFPEEGDFAAGNDFSETFDLASNHQRLVPVPRRIIRLLARGERKVAIATILGHLLRCLYYKRGLCLPEGTCKASWVAEVFGVDARNVKAARKCLVAMEWLLPVATNQIHLNRYGARVRVNLEWASGNEISCPSKRSPLAPKTPTGSPPLYKDKKLSTRNKIPETRGGGPAGVFQKGKGEGPQLRNVRTEDLHSATNLSRLFNQAVEERLIKGSEMDQLNFFAAAEHARTVGTKNPCGLFVTLVRRGLWHYITLSDEDAARQKLRAVCEGGRVEHKQWQRGRNAREHGPWSQSIRTRRSVQSPRFGWRV